MLRASNEFSTTMDIGAVTSSPIADPGFDPGFEVLVLTDAVASRDAERIRSARESLADMGEVYIEGVIAVAANFHMMNRILDASGLPVNDRYVPIGEELGFTAADWNRPV